MQISHQAFSEVDRAHERYKKLVEETALTDDTKRTYLLHADHFVRWLRGDFKPGERKEKIGPG